MAIVEIGMLSGWRPHPSFLGQVIIFRIFPFTERCNLFKSSHLQTWSLLLNLYHFDLIFPKSKVLNRFHVNQIHHYSLDIVFLNKNVFQ